jgi:hypothetical protein
MRQLQLKRTLRCESAVGPQGIEQKAFEAFNELVAVGQVRLVLGHSNTQLVLSDRNIGDLISACLERSASRRTRRQNVVRTAAYHEYWSVWFVF